MAEIDVCLVGLGGEPYYVPTPRNDLTPPWDFVAIGVIYAFALENSSRRVRVTAVCR